MDCWSWRLSLSQAAPCTFSLALFSLLHFYSLSTKRGAQTHGPFSARVHFCVRVFVPVHHSSNTLLHLFQVLCTPSCCQPTLWKSIHNSLKIHLPLLLLSYSKSIQISISKTTTKTIKHYTVLSKIPNLPTLSQVRH